MKPAFPNQNQGAAIIVMGVSGCGKSTVGELLAQALDCAFIEGDSLHGASSIAKMAAGIALTDDDRWPWLDRISAALATACTQQAFAVAACSALKLAYRQRLQQAISMPTLFIHLDTDAAVIARRMQQRQGHFMPSSLLATQLATLERPSSSERALVLDATLPASDLIATSMSWLSNEIQAIPLPAAVVPRP